VYLQDQNTSQKQSEETEYGQHTKNNIGGQVQVVEYVDSNVAKSCIHNTLIKREEVLCDLKRARIDEVEASHEYGGFTAQVLLKVQASLPGTAILKYPSGCGRVGETYGNTVALPTGTVFWTTFAPFSMAKAAWIGPPWVIIWISEARGCIWGEFRPQGPRTYRKSNGEVEYPDRGER
jgi:hypothetical protein